MSDNKQLTTKLAPEVISKLILSGDLSDLNPQERVIYYTAICERLGLDPVTKPFTILKLPGRNHEPDKVVMYCDRGGAAQLVKIHNVKREIIAREERDGCYIVTARASTPDHRSDESIGVVPVEKENGEWESRRKRNGDEYRFFAGNGTYTKLRGDALANAMMKAETKAKRRATLDLLGLGMLDESEISQEVFEPPITQDQAIQDREKQRALEAGGGASGGEPMGKAEEKKEEAKNPVKTVDATNAAVIPPAKAEKKQEPAPVSGKPLSERSADELPEGQKWRAHIIDCIALAEWKGRRLDTFSLEDLNKMKVNWVDKFAEKIASDPQRRGVEAMNILAALKVRQDQADGGLSDAEIEGQLGGTAKPAKEAKARKPRAKKVK